MLNLGTLLFSKIVGPAEYYQVMMESGSMV